MYIVRWLMGHPIIATWFLGAIAILLTMDASNKNAHETQELNASHAIESSEMAKESGDVSHEMSQKMPQKTHSNDAHEVTKGTNTEASSFHVHKINTSIESTLATVNGSVEKTKTSVDNKSAHVTMNENEAQLGKTIEKMDASIKSTVENGANIEAEKAVETGASHVAQAMEENTPDVTNGADNNQIKQKTDQMQTAVAVPVPTFSEGAAGLENTSADEMLLMAREAYWNNGLEEAAEIYIELIKKQPQKIEYKGELGNVYWRLGYPKKAAELYSEIALPMIEAGHATRVSNMVGFVGLFYPDRAAVIHQKLMSLQGGKQ